MKSAIQVDGGTERRALASATELRDLSWTRIAPSRGWAALKLHEVWEYRELLFFLTWRDVMVRYKQAALGVTWAIIQPLLTMVIFSIIFGQLAKLPSDGIPYPVFSFTALLPWQLPQLCLLRRRQ